MTLALLLVGCFSRPFEPWFDDPADGPVVTGVIWDPAAGLTGGSRATVLGGRLDTARTVVVGGRNATVLSTSFDRVEVALPSHAQAGQPLDLVVITDFGIGRLDEAITLSTAAGDFASDERVSVAVARVDCPIEGYGWDGEFLTPVLWCGAEFGYADAIAFAGAGVHPGLAADLLEIAPLGSAPPPGRAVHVGPGEPRPPTAPILAGPRADGDGVHLATPRDFGRDVNLLEQRLAWVDERYAWAANIDPTSVRRVALLFDADGELLGERQIDGGDGDELALRAPAPPDTASVWTGFRFVERYDDDPEVYPTEAWTGAAWVRAGGAGALADGPGGIDLLFDSFSGYYFPDGPAGLLAQSEVVRAPYAVSTSRLGVSVPHGTVQGGRPLALVSPDLMSGLVVMRTDAAAEIHWQPGPSSDDPAIVVAELRVLDLDVRDPNGQFELHRITATAHDAEGRLRFPRELLERLPARVENRLDENVDFVGLWGDLTVARHQLRKLPLADAEGDVVIDFLSVVNGPVALIR